ncbi:hypothetical protein FH972_016298 [Carpinus fangiana]|uniref:Leucine-rich repeat-containing N-terminal plant-type domain-containing protein n=1 Tax=Carpinus fangiana TaxID=176857 RepID=A0A5N6RIF4_9ROSI|nr:hypothetical protein FH972_016298 [Carpinus fangiana]
MATVMDTKTSFLVILVHCSLSFATIICVFTYARGNPNVLCREREREALITFKQGIIDPSNLLSSWIGEECCMWEGIGCDNITGHVNQLNLRNPYDPNNNAYESYVQSRLGGLISDSLLELKHLHYLDLSWNNFGGYHIPSFFGYLRNLRYLNLSYAGFVGGSPHQLANLSNLHYLGIGGLSLQVDSLEWLSHLSMLEFLDMSMVNLSEASNWLQVMNMLPSLSELRLSYCNLDKYDPIPRVNFSSLTVLDLSNNWFSNSTFDWLHSLASLVTLDLSRNHIQVSLTDVVQNMSCLRNLYLSHNNFSSTVLNSLYNISTLERLDLAYNNIQGVLPSAIGSLSRLMHLVLSNNGFQGKIPRSFGNLCNLQHLDLSGNKLEGDLEFLGNSSACTTNNLELLDLSLNRLSDTLPDQLGKHTKLFFLSLKMNMLSGRIPVSIGNLSSLRRLFLSGNQLTGTIPISFGHLSNLEELDISNNFLKGFVYEVHFSNLTNLRTLVANSNLLTLQVSSNWVPPFQINHLAMGLWRLGPRFPAWLQSQKDLQFLYLWSASISDVIPSWFWSMCSQFIMLNLDQNQLRGSIPSLSCGGLINLGSNNFSGPLPSISSSVTYLDLSNNSFHGSLSPFVCDLKDRKTNLTILDLSNNLLSGELPHCWMNYSELLVLFLGSNKLTGNIPSSLGSLSALQLLSLNKNNLSGELPLSLQNCKDLEIVDLSENHLSGGLSIWLGNSSARLKVLVLRLNKFHGIIPWELCHFNSLQIMDLSHNKFFGSIPRCVGNLSAMVRQVYDTSTIAGYAKVFLIMKGAEYEYNKLLALVTSMDLSSNNLIGEIPEELTSLYGIRFLNLSYNQLHGKIPENISGMTFCVGDDSSLGPTPNADDDGSEDGGWIDMKWFYISIPLGFVVGFWGVVGPLAFSMAWRYAFFKFLDDMKYKLFNGV